MMNGDVLKPGGPRWDDLMLVRAFDEAIWTYQEMHGLAVNVRSEELSKPGEADSASLDHLRNLSLQEVGAKESLPKEEASEDAESDVDECLLEELILAAHADDDSSGEQGAITRSEATAEEPLEALKRTSVDDASQQQVEENGTEVDQTGGAKETLERAVQSTEQEQTTAPESGGGTEEYTLEQYYEWLQWQASQQGAGSPSESTPPATIVNHHHYYYYSAEAACWQPGPASPDNAVVAPDTAPVHHSRAPHAPSEPPTERTKSLSSQLPTPSHSQAFHLPFVPTHYHPPASSGPTNAGAPVKMQRARFEPTHEGLGCEELYRTGTAMPEYSSTSVEKLRGDDCARGTRFVPFDPPNVGGFGFPDEYFQCLTAMPAYRNKSREELRWEDYALAGVPAGSNSGGIRREDMARVETGSSARPGHSEGLSEGRQHVLPGSALTREEAGSPSQAVQGFVFTQSGEGAPAEYEGADGQRQREGDAADSGVRSEGQHEASEGAQNEALLNAMLQQGLKIRGSQQQAESPAQRGLFGQQYAADNQEPRFEGGLPRPSSILAGAARGTQDGGALPEIDPVLQDLLSAYYWMGYQTARYLQSRRT